jgi:hypothetical protein
MLISDKLEIQPAFRICKNDVSVSQQGILDSKQLWRELGEATQLC